ncbi:MAG: vitamin K epoxide reductase family protein [Pyrobaculum arsenaticum]|uniref:Vitamin K epoxide reductase n=2 Tax=Pyrobaculum arsenaticum TaxID=121277 RepID=A4WKP9_PYRAR|nr:vitamin K epoxide reductase family protein [Pyrobaculum arsenaticum]ABP50966.1 Vitamin K epoxide reductase [Pyrobaculum arsenaticum DSM 13514]MCY0890186.1 vitamin K epoxide reductase family protein [Pyrobaculum arsenaticum]NYR15311.1 vitamin K epoxide reductase family protein [Pyrobaculum arsenaticum]
MNFWLPLLVVFSLGGLVASGLVVYLFYVLGQLPPGCYANVEILPGVTADCVKVLKSEYAYIGPVPLDVAAALWFVVNIAAALWLYRTLARPAARFIFWWRLLGLAILPYLIYLELAVLKAVCIYCTIMHAFIIADFVVISIFLKKMAPLIR